MSRLTRYRWVRRSLVVAPAAAAGGVGGTLAPWLAGAVGILVGLIASFVIEWWDDRHAPDLAAWYQAAKK